MIKVGDYVALKPNLTLGKAYGTVKFGKYHVSYLRKILKVVKISKVGTVYCNYNGYPCECGTFSEPMLNIARFKEGDIVRIVYTSKDKQLPYIGKVTLIKSIEYKDYEFVYHVTDDCGVFDWCENELELCATTCSIASTEDIINNEINGSVKSVVDEKLEKLSVILEDNENQLQSKDSNISRGERVKGSRVHGRLSQASVRSRPLRNAKSIRGK